MNMEESFHSSSSTESGRNSEASEDIQAEIESLQKAFDQPTRNITGISTEAKGGSLRMLGHFPEDIEKNVSSDYVNDSFVKNMEVGEYSGAYLMPAFAQTDEFYDSVENISDGDVLCIKHGGDELVFLYQYGGEKKTLFVDIGNMGPTNNLLGQVVQVTEEARIVNIVDLFLARVQNLAMRFLSKGDPKGFLLSVKKLGKDLTSLKEEEFEKKREEYEIPKEVDYKKYKEFCRRTLVFSRRRQIGRDLVKLFQVYNPEGNIKGFRNFLQEYFIDARGRDASMIKGVIEKLQKGSYNDIINLNKKEIEQKLKKMMDPNVSDKDYIIGVMEFLYLRGFEPLGEKRKGVEARLFRLRKPIEGSQLNKVYRHFTPKATNLLDAQGAEVSRHPKHQNDYAYLLSDIGPLEAGLEKAKLDKTVGYAQVEDSQEIPTQFPDEDKKESMPGWQIKQMADELEKVVQKLHTLPLGSEERNVLEEERAAQEERLMAIRYNNPRALGINTELYGQRKRLREYDFYRDLDEFKIITFDLHNTGALNKVGYDLVDEIFSEFYGIVEHVVHNNSQYQKMAIQTSPYPPKNPFTLIKDRGGRVKYVGLSLSDAEMKVIGTALNDLVKKKMQAKVVEDPKNNKMLLDGVVRDGIIDYGGIDDANQLGDLETGTFQITTTPPIQVRESKEAKPQPVKVEGFQSLNLYKIEELLPNDFVRTIDMSK